MNKDKVIGFATIALALLLVVYVAFAMWQREKRAQNTIYVQFDEMGALQNEDIVTIRGFEVGRIAAITRVRGKALVEIDFDEPRSFRKDTKFKNISPNIMGSRNIAIEPGAKGEFAPKDYVFDGEFEAGMAEILYLTDVAKEQVAIVMELVRLLHSGDEENSPFHSKFEDALTGIEELIAVLSRTVEAVESKALSALNTVGNYAVQISDASAKVGNSLDTIRLQARDGILAADKIVEKVNNSIANLNEAILQFESNSVTVALLDKKDIMNDLDSLSNALKSFVNAIDHKGIKIYDEKGKRKSMVTLKNIHPIRETARSKAKKRAAQEAR